MPRPVVTICSHRHINVLSLVELAKTMSQQNPSLFASKDKMTNHDRALMYSYGLLSNLKKLNNILHSDSIQDRISNMTPEDQLQVAKWIKVRDELIKRPLISTLLPFGAIIELSNTFSELVVFCQKAGASCNFTREHMGIFNHAEFNKCFKFDIFKGSDDIDEATSQGIRNGHTFIFLSGTGMIPEANDELLTIPGLIVLPIIVQAHIHDSYARLVRSI